MTDARQKPADDMAVRDGRTEAEPPRLRGDEPDVLVDVPELHVDEISLDVEGLEARLALRADVLELLKLHVGVDAMLDRVQLTIKGVQAAALLKVRLDNVARILERVLTTIDNNPAIVERLIERVGETVEPIGGAAANAVDEVGTGAGSTLEAAGETVADVGKEAAPAVGELGRGAADTVEGVGRQAESTVAGVREGTAGERDAPPAERPRRRPRPESEARPHRRRKAPPAEGGRPAGKAAERPRGDEADDADGEPR